MDPAITPSKKILLIVEDEVPLLQAMKDKFEQEDFSVVTARDGEEGLKTATSAQPNLIILDILMPKLGGLEMLRSLRAQGEYGKNVKVILLTNLDVNDKILKDVVEMQPTYYLIKSDMTIEGILGKVKEILDDSKPAPQS